MRDSITQAEFAALVPRVLQSSDVQSCTVQNRRVIVEVFSRPLRQVSKIFFDFDDGGKITGRYSFAQTQDSAGTANLLGESIAECIRRLRAD